MTAADQNKGFQVSTFVLKHEARAPVATQFEFFSCQIPKKYAISGQTCGIKSWLSLAAGHTRLSCSCKAYLSIAATHLDASDDGNTAAGHHL